MCLAVPAKVVERTGDEAVVDLQGSQLRISTVLTPQVDVGGWVLVHAGFAITEIDEADARETWEYLREALGDDARQADETASANPGEQTEDPLHPTR